MTDSACFERTILGLPTMIQEKVIKELDLKTVCKVAEVHPVWDEIVSPYGKVWKGLVEKMGLPSEKIEPYRDAIFKTRREKESFTGSACSYKDLYLMLLFRRPAKLMWITWMNGSYWDMIKSSDSMFGEIAHLENVCWLELTAAFRISVPGVYDVFWRLKMESSATLNEPKLIVRSKNIGEQSFIFNDSIQSYIRGMDWVNMKVARIHIGVSPIESSSSKNAKILNDAKKPIGKPYKIVEGAEILDEEIQVRMFSETGDWKRGLDVDFIEFVVVDPSQKS